MTDGWDERTEAIPGTRDDKSFELELDLDLGRELQTPMGTPALDRPLIVVFEPAPLGIAATLSKLGYLVTAGNTGVDVMSIVAARNPRLVVCAPAPDAERRRLLTAALRLRFPHVPIVYVSSHAAHEEAVLGAIREGARAVLPWPLPAAPDIDRVLSPFLQVATSASIEVPNQDSDIDTAPTNWAKRDVLRAHETSTGPQSPVKLPASEEADFVEQRTDVTEDVAGQVAKVQAAVPRPASMPAVPQKAPTVARPSFSSSSSSESSAPRPVPLPVSVLGPGQDDARGTMELEPTTQPGLRPVAGVGVEAVQERRGEIGELLAAISPFLWSLEDAGRWASALADAGDPVARNHARTLQLLAKILAQLQARIDEAGA